MKIELWCIGKTSENYLSTGISIYEKRLAHYTKYSTVILPDVKKFGSSQDLKEKEGSMVLEKLESSDYFILLDEKGKQYTSVQWAGELEKIQMMGRKRLVLLVAGAYGASSDLKKRADRKMSLSAMTFSHQMIRLFIVEQLYRGFTILRNEKYHNPWQWVSR